MFIMIILISIILTILLIYNIYQYDKYTQSLSNSIDVKNLLEDINQKIINLIVLNQEILYKYDDNIRISKLIHKLDLLLEDNLNRSIFGLEYYIRYIDRLKIYIYINSMILYQ